MSMMPTTSSLVKYDNPVLISKSTDRRSKVGRVFAAKTTSCQFTPNLLGADSEKRRCSSQRNRRSNPKPSYQKQAASYGGAEE